MVLPPPELLPFLLPSPLAWPDVSFVPTKEREAGVEDLSCGRCRRAHTLTQALTARAWSRTGIGRPAASPAPSQLLARSSGGFLSLPLGSFRETRA